MDGLRSSVESVAWPAVATGPAAVLMSLQRQLDESQWWTPRALAEKQLSQLRHLLDHVRRNVPFYDARLREAALSPGSLVSLSDWSRLPVLTRRDVQEAGESLFASEFPASHGRSVLSTSGGSTGIPVRVRKTELDNLMWSAVHVREEVWHREDPRGTMARIRRVPPGLDEEQTAAVRSLDGLVWDSYGPPTDLLWETGRVWIMDDRVPVRDQADFLLRLRPDYLFTFPANLRLLLSHFRSSAERPRFRSVWTMSEVVDDSMREACRSVFGCRIVHNYSSAETGYIALQCPASDGFHVQSEVVLLEVVRADGSPCEPGEVGRVLLTPLHNFASPLLRYEIGDEAELGGPCPCGRTLPHLRRIVGRTYDYLRLPDGGRRHVDTGYYQVCKVGAIREFQVVQRALDRIEFLVVASRPLTEDESESVLSVLRAEFGPGFSIGLSYRDHIERTEAGKLRTFVSDLPGN